uniref:RING-type E3 ubiquitin transferase n=1 Tax=Setaria italica TaxID=4555 RepID=K3XJS1_SETIT
MSSSTPQKRVSTPENGHGGKRPRALASPDGGVKQERRGQAEASQGGEGEGAVVAVQAMDDPQISVRISVARLHCNACLVPLKPPTFKCEAGHVVCSTCRGRHGQGCAGAGAYAACVELDDIVRDAKVPCAYEEYGCTSWVVYHKVVDHHRTCRWGPCFCPDSSCELYASPARLAEHFAAHHAWPVAKIAYGKPCKLAVPGPQGRQVLVGEGDGCVFLVSPCALGAATAVSLVCVRAGGDAVAGAPQFRCKLWVEVEGNKENLALVTSMVASSNLSGGFVAAEQGMFLAVPPELLHDESGEAPALMVRIDRAGAAAAAASARSPSATPPSKLPKRLQ